MLSQSHPRMPRVGSSRHGGPVSLLAVLSSCRHSELVLLLGKPERSETLVAPAGSVRLAELRPFDYPVSRDYAGYQRPAAPFAAFAAQQGNVMARLWPLPAQ